MRYSTLLHPKFRSVSAHYVRTVRDPGASLSADLFEAAAMKAVDKDLLAMKVGELKEELEARGEGRTGNKAWLRRRLCMRQLCASTSDPRILGYWAASLFCF